MKKKTFRSQFSSSIKSQDLFGHPVTLNFNQQGDTFATLLGGVVSVFIKVVLLVFLVSKVFIMISLGDNVYNMMETEASLENSEAVTVGHTKFIFFFSLNDPLTWTQKKFNAEELSKYVDIEWH